MEEAWALEMDAHAGCEQVLIVGALRELADGLIGVLRDDDEHNDAARRRRPQRLEKWLIRATGSPARPSRVMTVTTKSVGWAICEI